MYEIIVVGAGPAGSTFARFLSEKYSVLVIDKKTADLQGEWKENGFRKPCGGLLAPKAQTVLSSFGDTVPKDILSDPQIYSVKTIDLKNGAIRHYPRQYVNTDRHKFDLWLMGKINPSFSVKEGTVTKIEKTEKGYKVTYTANGESFSEECKYLVGADGASSIVRKFIAPKQKMRSYVSIQQWFESKTKPFYACVFDRKNTDCYSWALEKDGMFIFGGAYPHKNSRERFEDQKKSLEKYGFQFGEPVKTEACLVLRPKNSKSFCFGKDGIFLLGESAGLISPSGLEGISSALLSGRYLADAFNAQIANGGSKYEVNVGKLRKAYVKKVKKIKIRLLIKLLKCIPMYNPFCRYLVMKSGLTSIKVDEE